MNPTLTRTLGFALMGLGAVWLWQNFIGRKNDLTRHYEVEGDLQSVTNGVNATTQAALSAYPLTTIGDTPFAGLRLDPFMPDSPANQTKLTGFMQSIFSTRPSADLTFSLRDPNAN